MPRSLRFDLGLWRSTLGETHPHQCFAVEMDYWPQCAHVMSLRHEGVAVSRLVGGLVGCFAGRGGGSGQAMFRSDLVPLLDGAVGRWRAREADLQPSMQLDAFLNEVKGGFEALTQPPWHDHFDASAVAILFDDRHATIASVGLDRAFRLRKGRVEVVSCGRSVLDTLGAAERVAADDAMLRLLATLSASSFRESSPLKASEAPWQSRDVDLEAGDTFLLLAGADEGIFEKGVVAEAIAHAGPDTTAPEMARAIGVHLGAPSEWSSPPDAARATRIRWTVGSRVSIAVLRALDSVHPD